MIDWQPKERPHIREDVHLSMTMAYNGAHLMITFKNYCHELIAGGEYIELGIEGDRMYFREGTSATGYKLNGDSKHIKRFQVSKKVITDWGEFALGGHKLRKDISTGYYYIDRKEKK